jgi:hypothetical protein
MMTQAISQATVPRMKANPLDKMMTRAQVARRRFKAALPRKIGTSELSPLEALARTVDLFVRFMREMENANVEPKTKGKDHILAGVLALPKPGESGKIGEFADKVMKLDKPVFLGMLFAQHDMEAERAGDAKQASVLFACEFIKAYDAPARLLAARDQLVKGA